MQSILFCLKISKQVGSGGGSSKTGSCRKSACFLLHSYSLLPLQKAFTDPLMLT